MNGRRRSQRGVVLVVVLWLLLLMEVLVASQVVSARVESDLVTNRKEALSARAAAQAGLFMAIDMLAQQQKSKERLLRTDGGLYSMNYNDARVMVRVEDEAGKVDLNAARPELLRKLILSLSRDSENGLQVTDALLDWRDADHLRREYGAEDDDYLESDRVYGAKDEYFDDQEELLMVMGMDDALYTRLMAVTTVHTGDIGVNPLVAPRQVLRAIPGVGREQLDEYLQARDRYYTKGEAMPLFPVNDKEYISHNRDSLYTIHVEAETPGGSVARIAVVTRVSAARAKHGDLPYQIVRWNAHDRSASLQPNEVDDDA